MDDFKHQSVLLKESVDALQIRPDGIYVDCTMGGGGHSEAICRQLGPSGVLVGIDQDDYAQAKAQVRLSSFACRKYFVRDNFKNIKTLLSDLNIDGVNGILFDLGVSSFQYDIPERGFSYHHNGPLDMRMDNRKKTTAADIVAGADRNELIRILRDYGEEKLAPRIADAIIARRSIKPITETAELAAVVSEAYPEKLKRKKHPAGKTFQALRIAVNGELDILSETMKNAIDVLAPGGRLCVITFHSLEDRMIKQVFNTAADPCVCPKSFPVCMCGKKPAVIKITRKPIIPSQSETDNNRRARSAKLRVVEKIVDLHNQS